MKLIYLSNYRIPTQNALGIQITKMCEAFARKNIDVELIIPKYNKNKQDLFEYYDLKKIFKVKELPNFNLIKFGKYGFLVQTILFLVLARIYLIFNKYNILYTREQLAGLFFKNFIYEAHNFTKKVTIFHKILWKKVDKIIAITSFIEKDFVKAGVPANKILVAADAVDLEKFDVNFSQKNIRLKLNLPLDKQIVAFVGKYTTFKKGNKGVNDLIKILPQILKSNPNIFLLIVGVGEENINKVITSLKKMHIRDENYKIISHIPHKKVPYYLKASDVLMMNYSKFKYHTYYTSPMKMFEYMTSKRPIVASDLPSIREILNKDNSILIEPDNLVSLQNGIEKAFRDKSLSHKISNRAFADVQNYTWQKRSQSILKFIQR